MVMAPSLFEDNYGDILKKALFGLGLGESAAAAQSGVSPSTLKLMLEGHPGPDRTALEQLAVTLKLSPGKLVRLSANQDLPRQIDLPPNIELLEYPGNSSANCYLVRCPKSMTSFVIDPGGNPGPIMEKAANQGYKFTAMFLTHGHSDHTGGAGEISSTLGIPALALDQEKGCIQGGVRATFVKNGYALRTKSFTLRFIHVPGHTPGHGIVFGEDIGVAFTGDALFARSIGYAFESGGTYQAQLAAVRELVLELPWETIICPGHGPLTTVADEKALNAFFP